MRGLRAKLIKLTGNIARKLASTRVGRIEGMRVLSQNVGMLRNFIDTIARGVWTNPSESIGTSATLGLIGPEVKF